MHHHLKFSYLVHGRFGVVQSINLCTRWRTTSDGVGTVNSLGFHHRVGGQQGSATPKRAAGLPRALAL